MKTKSQKYYDIKYVSSQNSVAKDNIPTYKNIFNPHVTNDMTVLDYGCGSGVLLSVINCKYKIGVDINENALNQAKLLGINEVHKNLSNLKENSIDLIISNSALEHVPNPHQVLSELYNLKSQMVKLYLESLMKL